MLLMVRVQFSARLEVSTHGRGTYLLVHLPTDESDLIGDLPRVGFQGVKVEATIGSTTWKTTVFPEQDGFLMLVARKVAAAEALVVDEPVDVTLVVL